MIVLVLVFCFCCYFLLLLPFSSGVPLASIIREYNEVPGTCDSNYHLTTLTINGLRQDNCIGITGMLTESAACPNLFSFSPLTGTCHSHNCFLHYVNKIASPVHDVKDSGAVYDAPVPHLGNEGTSEEEPLGPLTKYVQSCYTVLLTPTDDCPESFVKANKKGVYVCYKASCGIVPSRNRAAKIIGQTEFDRTAAQCVEPISCPLDSKLSDGECIFPCSGNFEKDGGYCVMPDVQKPTCPENMELTHAHRCTTL